MYTIIRYLGIISIAIATFGCSKDDGRTTVPDPVQEIPEAETPTPALSSLSPNSGPKNMVVTVIGSHFGTDPAKIQVFFNDVEAVLESVTNEKIIVNVPEKAGTGIVRLMVNGQELTGPEFTYEFTPTATTIAGNGEKGYIDGIASEARLHSPRGIVSDKQGNLYIVGFENHSIRKISPDGFVSTFAGSGNPGDKNGTGTAAQFNHPWGLDIDNAGNIYVADRGNHKIRKITPDGEVGTIAGSDQGNIDGAIAKAKFSFPMDVAIDDFGTIYVADAGNERIRKITNLGVVSTVAGSSTGFADGIGSAAKFNGITDISIGSDGNIYAVDNENQKIRRITPNGEVTTFAGSDEGFADGHRTEALFNYPTSIAFDSHGTMYIGDENAKIRQISLDGFVSTVAGNDAGFVDGIGSEIKMGTPYGLTINSEGEVYFSDPGNQSIRKITRE